MHFSIPLVLDGEPLVLPKLGGQLRLVSFCFSVEVQNYTAGMAELEGGAEPYLAFQIRGCS